MDAFDTEVLRMWRRGVSLEELAEKLGTKTEAEFERRIHGILMRASDEMRIPMKKWTPEKLEEAISALEKAGPKQKELARKMRDPTAIITRQEVVAALNEALKQQL